MTKLQEICLFVFLFHVTVSVTVSINTSESSNDFRTLIISFIFSFEINKVNPFPALTPIFPLTFISNFLLHLKLNCLRIQVNCF